MCECCSCCPRSMETARFHPDLQGPKKFIIVNHLYGMTTERITQAAKKAGAIQDGKYFVLFGKIGADPEFYTKEEIQKKLIY